MIRPAALPDMVARVVDHPLFNAGVFAAGAIAEVLDYRAGRRVIAGELEHVDQLEHAPDGGNLPDARQVDVDWFGPAGPNPPPTPSPSTTITPTPSSTS